MAILAFWLFLGFFVGSLAIVWWTLYVDHDVTEETYEEDDKSADSNPLAGLDGVSLSAALSLWYACGARDDLQSPEVHSVQQSS